MRPVLLLTGCCLLGFIPAAQGQRSDVLPATQRARTIELANQLAAPAAPAPLPAVLKNPFTGTIPAPAVTAGPRETVAPAVVSNRQLLEAIAPLVNPSGSVALGGEPILLFGQKRIKVGDTLSISFDGEPYELVISNIQSTSFTLRLRGEEITRPIKPANRP
jgi:hypothetical protein